MPQVNDNMVPSSGAAPDTSAKASYKTKPGPVLESPATSSRRMWLGRLLAMAALCWASFAIWAVVVWAQDSTVAAPSEGPSSRVAWSFALNGEKLAAPVDLNSDGEISELVVVNAGEPGGLYALSADGKLRWSHEFIPHLGYAPNHVAPVDYDSDGLFDEVFIEVRGSATDPDTVVIGPEAYTFNFWIIDSHGGQLWYQQCGYLTAGWVGASLSCPECDASEADQLYREKVAMYGLTVEGRLVDERFNRIDLDGDGQFTDIVVVEDNQIEIYTQSSQ